MKSVTRELKKTIKNTEIRKNIKSIYVEYDEEYEMNLYYINFKEETVKSAYSCEYIETTTCKETDDINSWLDEITYVE